MTSERCDVLEFSERLVGAVDTCSFDTLNGTVEFNGWAVDEAEPSKELEFKVSVEGQEYPVRITRHARSDLTAYDVPDPGFTITVSEISIVSIAGPKALKIHVRSSDARSSWSELPIGKVAIEHILRQAWLGQIALLNDAQVNALVSELFPRIRALVSETDAERPSVTPPNGMALSECTQVYMPKGFTSFDGSCVLGAGGHAFLVGGSNGVLENYTVAPDSPVVVDQCKSWIDLFKTRQAECTKRNIIYVQTIIPEKLSVMPELVDYDINGPTQLLSSIERFIEADINYVSGYRALIEENKFATFDAIDTHFSAFGAFKVFDKIIKAAGILEDIAPIFQTADHMMVGDIAERFIVNSTLMYPDTIVPVLPVPLSQHQLELVEEFDPPSGGHIGARRIFRNPLAPIDRRLLVFGNSFFERGGHPKTLTWWFARMFTEFHFIWHPDFDWDYVDQASPDVVIGQTIERFLNRLPEA